MSEWAERRAAGIQAVSAILLLALFLYTLSGPLPALRLGPAVLFLGLASIFEILSPRLPKRGYQSCSAGIYLAVALSFPNGWGVAAVLALNLFLVRGLSESYRAGYFADEFLANSVPLMALLACSKALHHYPLANWLAIAVYLGLFAYYPRFLVAFDDNSFHEVRKRLLLPIAGLLCAGLTFRLEPDAGTLSTLIYFSLVISCREVAGVQGVAKKELALIHFDLITEAQEKIENELHEVSLRAHSGREGQRLLAKVQGSMASASSLEEGLETVLRDISGVFESRSLVVFLATEEGLLPFAYQSPDSAKLEGAPLTGLTEPLAHVCWRESRPFFRRRRNWPPRLLEREKSVICVPIPGYGVLYLGRESYAFQPSDMDTLTIIGRQLSLSIQLVLERLRQAQRFTFISDERRRLERWLHRLEGLMDTSHSLYLATDEEEVYRKLGEALQDLIPHRAFAVAGDGEQALRYSSSPSDWDGEALASLVRRMKTIPKSIFNERLHLALGEASILAVPIPRHRIALVLADTGPSLYTAEQKNLLEMIASIAASALDRLRLQEEYLVASKSAAIGQFAAGVSHELNTPLGVVQLQLERASMLLEKSPNKAQELLSVAETELERAQHMISTLLYYSTSYAVNREVVELKSMLERVVEELELTYVVFEFEEINLRFNGFPLDLEQMFRQLLDNARDAVAQRTDPKISLRAGRSESEIFVEVHDNGEGLSKEVAEKAMDPFFTTKPVGRGVGLGLTVASQVARLHGGRLDLLRSPLGGVNARVSMPVAQV